MNNLKDIDLDLMRHSGRVLGQTLNFITKEFVKPGMSSLEVSEKAREFITSHEGCTPAFLGYRGFPGAACISINEEVVHGIPRADKIINEGDIFTIDCGVIFKGHYSDAARTIAIGDIDPRKRKLIKATAESLDKGIAAARPGGRIGDISYAIQRHVERNRFNVSLEFVGHGIGLVLHDIPQVPNYGPPGQGEVILAGQCFALEPVVFDGSPSAECAEDGWTILSCERNMSAHFEDTIIITKEGAEIITRL